MAITLKKRKKEEEAFIDAAPQKVEAVVPKKKDTMTTVILDEELKRQVGYLKSNFRLPLKTLAEHAIKYATQNETKLGLDNLEILPTGKNSTVLLPSELHADLKSLAKRHRLKNKDCFQRIIKAYIRTLKIEFP